MHRPVKQGVILSAACWAKARALSYFRHKILGGFFRRSITILLVLACCVMEGCSSKPPMLAKPVQNNWTVSAPLETLWKSGIQALVDKGVQIDIIDKESGLIVAKENFDGMKFSEYVAEPQSFYAGEAKVNVLLSKKDEKTTQLTIKCAMFGLGRTYVPAKVTSNGKIERDYYLVISGSVPREKSYKWLEDSKTNGEKN